MEVLGYEEVVVEALVEVDLAVAIRVVQPGDAVAAQDVDLLAHHLDAQGLEQAGGDALPGDVLQCVVDAAHQPDVAAPGGDDRPAVGEEVQRPEAHPRFVGVVEGHVDLVNGVGILVLTADALGGDGLVEAGLAALGQRGQIARDKVDAQGCKRGGLLLLRPGPQTYGEAQRFVARRNVQEDTGPLDRLQSRPLRHLADAHRHGLVVTLHANESPGAAHAGHSFDIRDHHRQGRTARAQVERARETDVLALAHVFHRGHVQHLRAADGVLEDDAGIGPVQPLVAAPVRRQRAVADVARILEIAVPGPTGRGLRREQNGPAGAGVGPVVAAEGDAVELEEAAAPADHVAQHLGVENDAGLGLAAALAGGGHLERHGDAAVGDVALGNLGLVGGAQERPVIH